MTEEAKTTIRPDISGYQKAKAASGAVSHNNGDSVATALQGANLDEVYSLAAEITETPAKDLQAKYGHLNAGQQRMNLGNRIRGVVNKMNKEKEGSGDKFIKSASSGIRDAVAQREKAAAAAKKEKEAAAAAKAKEKQAKSKAKAA